MGAGAGSGIASGFAGGVLNELLDPSDPFSWIDVALATITGGAFGGVAGAAGHKIASALSKRLQPVLGNKLNYLFGRSKGSPDKSLAMLRQLERVGIRDTVSNRMRMGQYCDDVLNDSTNVARIQENGRAVKESLLTGPRGFLKSESIWEGTQLITFKVFGTGTRFKHGGT